MRTLSNNCSLILYDKPSIRFLTVSFDKGIYERSLATFSLINAETMIFVAGNISSSASVCGFPVLAIS